MAGLGYLPLPRPLVPGRPGDRAARHPAGAAPVTIDIIAREELDTVGLTPLIDRFEQILRS